MANVNRPLGFLPLRYFNGTPYDGKFTLAVIPSSDGTDTYRGDVVVISGGSAPAGTVISGLNCEGIPYVKRAASGTTGQNIFGVVTDFLVDPTNLALKYRVASTARVAMVVAVDFGMVFEIQEDADTTPVPATAIGDNAAFTLTAGNTATGNSGMELDSSSVNTTSTLPLKVLGLVKRVDNAFNTAGAGTDPAKFEVMFNTGVFAPNVAGV